jgi:class 3 adenylate cyclase
MVANDTTEPAGPREPDAAAIHGLTLRFPPELERAFLDDYFHKSVTQVRIGQVVGAAVYAAFAIIDPWVIPQIAPTVWIMRAVVIACFALAFVATFERGFRRWFQPVVTAIVLVAGLSMAVVLLIAPSPERELYFGGIVLITMAGYTYMKLRFTWAVLAAMVMWGAYDAADILVRDTPLAILVTNNLYLLATNVVGMFAGYHMELYIRRDFLQRRQIEQKDERLSRVLLNVLPASIAERLMTAPCTIAERFGSVTIMFTDIVHFTQYSSHVPPEDLVAMLNEIFSAFDQLVEKHGLEKIKTIGDAYMAAAGLPTLRDDHAEAVAEFALDLQEALARLNSSRSEPIRIRIGIHTGPVVAGVIGTKRFAYDLWGDAVNTASRMESHALPDTIQVSRTTYERLRERFELKRRGPIEVKGKGEMVTYLLIGRKP